MLRQLVIMIFLSFFPVIAWAEDPSVNKDPLEGLGLQLFSQSLNSELSLQDETDREVILTPEPPGFIGAGISYKGIGLAYAEASNSEEDRLKRSDASGFKWTIPWDHILFEFYKTSFEGVAVDGSSFRSDVEVETTGAHVTWARDKNLKFSGIFGLDSEVSKGRRPGRGSTYYTASLLESVWNGETSFWPTPTGTDDTLAFRYLRRRAAKLGIGRAYVKYYTYHRFSIMGDIGAFAGNRVLKYENNNLPENESTESGLTVSLAFSFASDIGFRRLSKKWGTNFNYGINFVAHQASSFGDENIGTNQRAVELYLGTLW